MYILTLIAIAAAWIWIWRKYQDPFYPAIYLLWKRRTRPEDAAPEAAMAGA